MISTLRKRLGLVFATAALLAVTAMSGVASAAQDYSALTTGFRDELTAALPVALAGVGLFLGVMMAYRVVRNMMRT